MSPRRIVPAALIAVLAISSAARAQTTSENDLPPLTARRIALTPFGALPPLAPPMPASRANSYLGVHAQVSRQFLDDGRSLDTFGAGLDLQWLGGSVIRGTVGYQTCDRAQDICDDHLLFGLRGRLNVLTTGPSIGVLVHDYSTTFMVAVDVGAGAALDALAPASAEPDSTFRRSACSYDIGLPLAVGLLESVRVTPFVIPGLAWDVDCGRPWDLSPPSWVLGFGVGLQQVLFRGLDIHIAMQKILERKSGHQLGISITFVRLP